MRSGSFSLKQMVNFGVLLMMGTSMSACGNSWKEEVLLHDGKTIVVDRSVKRGGRHEIGQQPPIKEQTLIWDVPGTDQRLTWKSEFSEDVGLADLTPLAVDIVQSVTYVISTPVGCLAYNKWGRPNPPYVVFRRDNDKWQRIALQELPTDIKKPNLIISSPDNHVGMLEFSPLSTERIQRINSSLTQPEYKSILREPVGGEGSTSCPIPSDATGKLIAPEVDGKPLYYNWWPLAQDWLDKKLQRKQTNSK